MRSDMHPFVQALLRALVLTSSPVVDAHGPSPLRLRLHRLRVQTAPIGAEL